MRLIDADALKNALAKRTGLKWEHLFIMVPFCRMIDDAPTIHPKPPKIGKWIPHPHEPQWDVCSVCGIGVRRRVGDDEYSYCFCPWCGAKMEETK